MQDWLTAFFEWSGSTATIGLGTFIAAAVVILKFYKDRADKRVYSLVLFHDLWKVTALALSISITVIIAPKVLVAAGAAVSAAANAEAANNAAVSARDAVGDLTDMLERSIPSISEYAALNSRVEELEAERIALREENGRLQSMLSSVEGPLEGLLSEVATYAAERSGGSVDRDELFRGLLDDFRARTWPP